MNFDQMVETWRLQDDKPLYGVNCDLLQLVLQHEQADLRRALRWEQWITYVAGTAMTGLAVAVLWWFLHFRGPDPRAIMAAAGAGAFALWIGAVWLSRKRQTHRERGFANTLHDEIRRNLSLVDYQLSQAGRWSSAMLRSAPILIGASLTFWLITEINDNTDVWFDVGMVVFMIISIVWSSYETSCRVSKELIPRRQRLSHLLETLDTP